MVRFKKGSKVEISSRNGGSCGVWRCAEILSGNGSSFSVVFDDSLKNNKEDLVAKVSRKAIRPCPPLNDNSISWSQGDLVEVFEDLSWKTAVVLKVLSSNYYLVKLIGFSRELQLKKIDIRVRQLWQDGEWIVIGKGSQSAEELKTNKITETVKNCLTAENNTCFHDSCAMADDRTRKRSSSPFWSSNGKASKIRAMEKNGEHQRRSSLEPNESGIVQCSVGSCSVGSNSLCGPAVVGNSNDEDSDAESFYSRDEARKGFSFVGVNVDVRIHSLELQAYRSTLEALYASGPLNWEQEVLLTNLRMSLNISNDEHLFELKNLIATRPSIHVR